MKKSKEHLIGTRNVLEAFDKGTEISKVFLKRGAQGAQIQEIIKLARQLQVPIQYVPVEKLNRINSGAHQGVIAVVSPIPYYTLESVVLQAFDQGRDPFILILDQITDVRNFGGIARTAECAGVDALVIPDKGSVMITEDAMKTSAGALNKIPVCRVTNLDEAVKYLRNSGLFVVAASEKAEKNYHDIIQPGPIGIIMGSEEKGISQGLLREADALAKIPMAGTLQSLNVNVACGIFVFEVVKLRLATI